MKKFLSWFLGPGGGLIGLGVLASRWLGLLWHRLADWDLAQTLWVQAGGNMPFLVSLVSSFWFGPALIVGGFAYTLFRWRLDGSDRTRAAGRYVDGAGWFVVAATAVLLLATVTFDRFLTESGATDFAVYVNDQRAERHLKPEEVVRIVSVFGKIDPPFKIVIFAIDIPEAIAYGREFMAAFHEANQTVNGKGPDTPAQDLGAPFQARLYSPKLHGLLIGARPNADITKSSEAIRFQQAISEAGLKISGFVGWDGLGPEGFNFIVGPR